MLMILESASSTFHQLAILDVHLNILNHEAQTQEPILFEYYRMSMAYQHQPDHPRHWHIGMYMLLVEQKEQALVQEIAREQMKALQQSSPNLAMAKGRTKALTKATTNQVPTYHL